MKSLELIPAVEASMLNYLFPIFIVLFAVPIHKEKLNLFKLISIGMGFMGTLLLITKGDLTNINFTNFKGDLLAILAAVSWGLFTNFMKMNKKDMLLSTFFVTVVGFVLSVVAVVASSPIVFPQRAEFFGDSCLSISNIVPATFLFNRALKYSPASLIASFSFLTPFITLIFIVLLSGETMALTDVIAALFIFFSVPIQGMEKFMGRNKGHRLTQ